MILCVFSLQRCKERLRESREKFLTRFRHITSETVRGDEEAPVPSSSLATPPLATCRIGDVSSKSVIASSVQEVMMEEWEHVRLEYGNLPQLPQSKKLKIVPTQQHTSKEETDFMVNLS